MWKYLAQVLPLCYWHHRLGQPTYFPKGVLPARLAGVDIYLSPPGLPPVRHGQEFPKWSPNAAAQLGMWSPPQLVPPSSHKHSRKGDRSWPAGARPWRGEASVGGAGPGCLSTAPSLDASIPSSGTSVSPWTVRKATCFSALNQLKPRAVVKNTQRLKLRHLR